MKCPHPHRKVLFANPSTPMEVGGCEGQFAIQVVANSFFGKLTNMTFYANLDISFNS